MLKIKLQPTGKRNQKLFRIVVAEDRSKLTGKYIDLLGHYNPKDPQNSLALDRSLYQSWLKKGAQPTNTLRLLINKKIL